PPAPRGHAAESSGTAPAPGRPGAARRDPGRAPCGRARPPRAASPDSGSSRGRHREDSLVQLRLGRRRLQARFLLLQTLGSSGVVELQPAALAAARFGPLKWREDCVAPPRGETALEVETDA